MKNASEDLCSDRCRLSSWFQDPQWPSAAISSPESGGKLLASGADFKREELSFSHRVAEHVIAHVIFFPGLQLLRYFRPCCFWKQIFKQNPQMFLRFVAKWLCMQIWHQFCIWWKGPYKFGLLVGCCLHCVPVFGGFVIKGSSVSSLRWTLSCNRGIN